MDPKHEDKKKDGEGFDLGQPLLVPSVQEIVRKDPSSVPERYIREPQDRPGKSLLLSPLHEIPVIDLSLLISGDETELKKLNSASKLWGFFQIVNHGVAEEVLTGMKAAQASFYELPLEEKMKHRMNPQDMQGYGNRFVLSEKQKLNWNDGLFLAVLPVTNRKFNYWPLGIPGFKEAIEQYSREMSRVTEVILANISRLMGLPEDALKKLHGEMRQGMRMNYYPSCSRPDLVIAGSPHSDLSSVTLLLQDDHLTALQVRHKDGWIPVKPINNSLVVNFGDVMEGWSNGVYKSVEHRVVANETAARMSIATFAVPEDQVDIGPMMTNMLEVEGRPIMYGSLKYIDYVRLFRSRRLFGKAKIELLKIDNEVS